MRKVVEGRHRPRRFDLNDLHTIAARNALTILVAAVIPARDPNPNRAVWSRSTTAVASMLVHLHTLSRLGKIEPADPTRWVAEPALEHVRALLIEDGRPLSYVRAIISVIRQSRIAFPDSFPPPPLTGPSTPPPSFLSDSDIEIASQRALSLPALNRERILTVIALTAGAGLSTAEITYLRFADIKNTNGRCMIEVTTPLQAERVIPVRRPYAARLSALGQSNSTTSILRQGRSVPVERSVVQQPLYFLNRHHSNQHPTLRVTTKMLRGNWLRHVVAETPADIALHLAGWRSIETIQGFVDTLLADDQRHTIEQLTERTNQIDGGMR